MAKILVVYGTRPEAIKMAPVIRALSSQPNLQPVVAVTGQHREMLDQVNTLFGIEPSHDLDIIQRRQSLEDITSRVLLRLGPVLDEEQPDAVLVQGDTTTCAAAALSAFYRKLPVIHLEAGLRTGDAYDPYPEEMNRRLTAQLTALHLAPTSTSRRNLLAEGVDPGSVAVTGNTVIDALHFIVAQDIPYQTPSLGETMSGRLVLVTTHRRESWGAPMERTGRALRRLSQAFPDVGFILPAHLNPIVRETLLRYISGRANILVTDPLPYSDFARLMQQCELVLTDSGGVQEEAPSLGKPVLVLRDTTERPEAVTAGTVRVIGTDEDRIVKEVSHLLSDSAAYDQMARAVNPYGDGLAAVRCIQAIRHLFGEGERAADFHSGP